MDVVEYVHRHDAETLTNAHFSMAISACDDAKQWHSAVQLIDTLFNSSVLAPDLININGAISSCASAGATDAARALSSSTPCRAPASSPMATASAR